jgi:hypothetical protein
VPWITIVAPTTPVEGERYVMVVVPDEVLVGVELAVPVGEIG